MCSNFVSKRKLRPDLNGALFVRSDPSTRSGQANKKAGMEGGNVRHKKIKTHIRKSQIGAEK
jgi:hypothetical protein